MHKLLAISAAALTFISVHFLDFRVSSFVLAHAGKRFLLGPSISSLPDGLLLTVIIASILSWTGYFLLSRRGIADRRTRFFKLIGISLPMAFAIKALLKWVFGRMEPEYGSSALTNMPSTGSTANRTFRDFLQATCWYSPRFSSPSGIFIPATGWFSCWHGWDSPLPWWLQNTISWAT